MQRGLVKRNAKQFVLWLCNPFLGAKVNAGSLMGFPIFSEKQKVAYFPLPFRFRPEQTNATLALARWRRFCTITCLSLLDRAGATK